MSTSINRREFIRNSTTGAAALGLAASGLPSFGTPVKKQSNIKVGLYSITYLGVWYRGPAMTLDDMMVKAKKMGFDGIEIDGKRPHGNPLDLPTKRCKELKSKAESEGLDIYAVSANNDFSSPIPEYRECQIVYLRDLIRMTSDLGVKPLRVFLGWPGVTKHPQIARYDIARDIWNYTHYQFTAEEIWDWCREGLIECCKFASDYGVTLALQNHKPVINSWKDVMRMVKEVNSPNLKVCLDAPILEDKSPENIKAAAEAVGPLQVLSHFGGEYDRDANGKIMDTMPDTYKNEPGYVDAPVLYSNFAKAMKSIGYSGYFSFELCHPLPIKNGQTVGIEYADQCASLACEMMKGILSTV